MPIPRPEGPLNQLLTQLAPSWDYIDLNLSAGSGIDVSSFATGGDGTVGSPWTGWDTALTFVEHTTYHYRKGHYAYATSPNFLKTGIAHIGDAGVFFHHTGTGDGFRLETDDLAVTWYHRMRIENITVLGHVTTLSGAASATIGTNTVTGTGTSFTTQVAVGDAISFDAGGPNAETRLVTLITDNTHLTVSGNWLTTKTAAGMKCGKTRHGVYMAGCRNVSLKNITVHDVANSALYAEWCVTNYAELFVTSYHDPIQSTEFQIRSQYGIKLDHNTTTFTFLEPVIEGTQEAGIYTLDGSYGNTFVNGTSEGNKGNGAVFASVGNTIINTDFEANEGLDVEVLQSRNRFINAVIEQSITITAGQGNRIEGGVVGDIVVDGDMTVLDGAEVLGAITGAALASLVQFPYVNTPDGNIRMDTQLGNVLAHVKDLSMGATVNTNARDANIFYGVSNANLTLANPTNPRNGQEITWRLVQGATHTIAFGSKFRPAATKDFPVMPTVSGDTLYLVAKYNSTDDKWDIVWANNEVFGIFVASDITAQDLNATGGYSVDDVQVLTNQQPAIADPTGGATVDSVNRATTVEILGALRNHGLIAVTPPFDLDFVDAWFPVRLLTFEADALANKARDFSGNRRHLLQGTLAKRPIFKANQINGFPALRFDGVDDEMRTGAFAYNQARCISMVIKRFNNAFKYLYSSLADFGLAMFQGDGTSDDKVSMFAGSGSGDPNGVIDSGAWYLVTAEYNGASSNLYENTILVDTGNPGTQNGNGLVVGNRYDGALPCQFDMAEKVIYDPSIRSDVETFLMDLYNL